MTFNRVFAAAGLLVTAAAFGQTTCPPSTPGNCLTNPSFEEIDMFTSSLDPVGWHNLSNPNESKRRQIGDGLQPPAVARTGIASVMIKTPGFSEFRGMTTDWLNFDQNPIVYYDPVFDWFGGDVVVSGWYYIPTSDPITGDMAFMKLNVKRRAQDYATFDAASEGPDSLRIQGHTNNQWRYYELRWPMADIQAEVMFNYDQGYFNLPPYPDHLKIVLSRFGFGNVPSTGTIFWDDIQFHQEPLGPVCSACAADYNQDGGVDGADVASFFQDWEASGSCADVNLDGGIDGGDVESFFSVWEAGGC
ncbi:MAG: hypothetical protein JSR77_12875 [Planctomycetes bacterium]|nr:hypothetical protein [Planctomycetota bacterium]